MKKFFLLTSAILTLFACSSDDPEVPAGNDDPVNDDPNPVVENAVRLRNDADFGNVLTNSEGFTLYFCIISCMTVLGTEAK